MTKMYGFVILMLVCLVCGMCQSADAAIFSRLAVREKSIVAEREVVRRAFSRTRSVVSEVGKCRSGACR